MTKRNCAQCKYLVEIHDECIHGIKQNNVFPFSVSVILGVVPVARQIGENNRLSELLRESFVGLPYRVTLESPYSLVMFGAGTLLVLFAMISQIIHLLKNRKAELDDDYEGKYNPRTVSYAAREKEVKPVHTESRKPPPTDDYYKADTVPSKWEPGAKGRGRHDDDEYSERSYGDSEPRYTVDIPDKSRSRPVQGQGRGHGGHGGRRARDYDDYEEYDDQYDESDHESRAESYAKMEVRSNQPNTRSNRYNPHRYRESSEV